MLEKNSLFPAEITGYASDGMGIARIDGMVVFVAGGVRGDLCTVKILKVLKNKAYARIESLTLPSPHRAENDCPAYPRCGGCQLRHMSYEEELFFKKQRVTDALQRIAGIEPGEFRIVGSPAKNRYRNKAVFPCAMQNGRPEAGFYRAHSHEIIPCEDCLLQTEAANALCRAVLDWAAETGAPLYDEEKNQGLLRHIYVRTGKNAALLTLCCTGWNLPQSELLIEKAARACPNLAGIVINRNAQATNRILGEECRTLWGSGVLNDTLCGVEFALSPLSFYQVNHDQAKHLYEKAVEYAALEKDDLLLDLYCGTGTITSVMARHCKQAIGVEIVPQAIEDAKENARRADIRNASFFCADAAKAARQLAEQGLMPRVICIDPPRKGMDQAACDAILRLAPQRVVYVSCDPATMARDLALLQSGGYQPQKLTAFDMFPRTNHVETVVLMSKVQK